MVEQNRRMRAPPLDVIAFGATSFVGQILCCYLLEEFGTHRELRWAAAGRSQGKLEELRASLGSEAATLPLVVADAADDAALRKLCASTRVMVSTVGPYALHGEPLVRACAESGTDYCDLTGEVQWIRRMVERYEAAVRKSGARIVHCCGFDFLPSDLGVHFLQSHAMSQFAAPWARVKMRVKVMRGGFSGGTVASLMNLVKEAAADPALRKELADPYSLCPAATAPTVRQPEVRGVEFDSDFGAWIAPFVMSAINTRIVHRTNALSERAYGADFRYDEAMLMGRGLKGQLAGAATTAGLAGFMLAGAVAPLRGVSSVSCFRNPAKARAPRSSATVASTCALSARRVTAARSAPRSPAIAIRATGPPARCSARRPRASHSTSREARRRAASGPPPRY